MLYPTFIGLTLCCETQRPRQLPSDSAPTSRASVCFDQELCTSINTASRSQLPKTKFRVYTRNPFCWSCFVACACLLVNAVILPFLYLLPWVTVSAPTKDPCSRVSRHRDLVNMNDRGITAKFRFRIHFLYPSFPLHCYDAASAAAINEIPAANLKLEKVCVSDARCLPHPMLGGRPGPCFKCARRRPECRTYYSTRTHPYVYACITTDETPVSSRSSELPLCDNCRPHHIRDMNCIR